MSFLLIKSNVKNIGGLYLLLEKNSKHIKLHPPRNDYNSYVNPFNYKLEKETSELILQLLGAGGIISLLKIIKDWIKNEKASIHYIDKNKGLEFKITGSIIKEIWLWLGNHGTRAIFISVCMVNFSNNN